MTKPGHPRCPDHFRSEAIELFEQGLGYKATAAKLNLHVSTVRDWKRMWKAGVFTESTKYRKPLTQQEVGLLIFLKEQKFPDAKIAEMFECSTSLVQKHWRQYRKEGAAGTKPIRKRKRLSEEAINLIIAMRKRGEHPTVVAEAVGCTPANVNYHWKRYLAEEAEKKKKG